MVGCKLKSGSAAVSGLLFSFFGSSFVKANYKTAKWKFATLSSLSAEEIILPECHFQTQRVAFQPLCLVWNQIFLQCYCCRKSNWIHILNDTNYRTRVRQVTRMRILIAAVHSARFLSRNLSSDRSSPWSLCIETFTASLSSLGVETFTRLFGPWRALHV